MSLEPKRAYKIVLIGDPKVGKTSIRRKYMGISLNPEYLKTIGADFAAQKVDIEGETVLLTIWDLAGQSIFHGMRSSFYLGCKSALVVFDVTDPSTLENVSKWAEEATTYAKGSLQEIYVIGNKIDLEEKRKVTNKEAEAMMKHLEELTNFPIRMYETSALTGENIQALFKDLCRRLVIGDEIVKESSATIAPILQKDKNAIKRPKTKENKKELIFDIIKDIENNIKNVGKMVDRLKKELD